MDLDRFLLLDERSSALRAQSVNNRGKITRLQRVSDFLNRITDILLGYNPEIYFNTNHILPNPTLQTLIDQVGEATQAALRDRRTEYRRAKATEAMALGHISQANEHPDDILLYDFCGGYSHAGLTTARARSELGNGQTEIHCIDIRNYPEDKTKRLETHVLGPHLDAVTVKRITADVRDIEFTFAEDGRRTYLVSKHSCGGVTDLGIKKVTQDDHGPHVSAFMPCCHNAHQEYSHNPLNKLTPDDWRKLLVLAGKDTTNGNSPHIPFHRLARRLADTARAIGLSQSDFDGTVTVNEVLPRSISTMNHIILIKRI